MVDATSFVALKVFTAIMTGNVVFAGLALSGQSGVPVLRAPIAVLAFVLGAVLVGRLQRKIPRTVRCPRSSGWLLVTASFVVATSAGLYAVAAPSERWVGAVAALVAAAMGIQVAVVRRMAVPDLSTVVLTITIASWAVDSRIGRGERTRARRRVAAVAAMLLGALVGGMLVQLAAPLSLGLGALVLLVAGLLAVRVAASEALEGVVRLAE